MDFAMQLKAFTSTVLGEDHPLIGLLKASSSQGIVAPVWVWFKLSLLGEFPFKDVKLGWFIYVSFQPTEVFVIHQVWGRTPVVSPRDSSTA